MSLIKEGKTKLIFSTEKEGELLFNFSDGNCLNEDVSLDLKLEKETIANKFNKYFFFLVDSVVPNHLIEYKDNNSFLAQKLDIIPLKVVIRNFSAGTICQRRGYKKGEWFLCPLIEYFVKTGDDILPEVLEAQIEQSGMMNYEAIDKIIELTKLVNDLIKAALIKKDILLIDVELEFGVTKDNNIILADELSPYNIRMKKQNSPLYWDKDIFKTQCDQTLINSYNDLLNILEI